MKRILLNLRRKKTRDALYDGIAAAFDFPDYFGRNLDALYDCLTELSEQTTVLLLLPGTEEAADAAFSSYLEKLRGTFEEAAANNPRLTLFVRRV